MYCVHNMQWSPQLNYEIPVKNNQVYDVSVKAEKWFVLFDRPELDWDFQFWILEPCGFKQTET